MFCNGQLKEETVSRDKGEGLRHTGISNSVLKIFDSAVTKVEECIQGS